MISSSSGSCGSDRNRSVSHISPASTLPRHARDAADQDAEAEGHEHGREADRERDAPAIEHPRQHILPEIVGAERMRERRPLQGRGEVDLVDRRGPEQGPTSTARMSSSSTAVLATARRCRRKRRQASCQGPISLGGASAVS
jgi:hypothetical protein